MGGISVKVKAEGAVVHQYILHPPCGKQTETAWQQLEICARLHRVKSPRSSGRWPEGGSSWHSWRGRQIWGWTKRGRKQDIFFFKGCRSSRETKIRDSAGSQHRTWSWCQPGVQQGTGNRCWPSHRQGSNSQAWGSGHRRLRGREQPLSPSTANLWQEVGNRNRKNCCTKLHLRWGSFVFLEVSKGQAVTEQEHKRVVSGSMWSEAEVELEAPLTTGKPTQGWCRPIKLGNALQVGYFCIARRIRQRSSVQARRVTPKSQ